MAGTEKDPGSENKADKPADEKDVPKTATATDLTPPYDIDEELQTPSVLRNKGTTQASPKGKETLNSCFIPTADGHYTRLTGPIDDKPKTSLTSGMEEAGRFVMINPQTQKVGREAPNKVVEKKDGDEGPSKNGRAQ